MKHFVLAAFLAFPAWAEAAELPLKRVVLSTSGLAQFTRAGEVGPGTMVELPVRLDQVDDVLKSLTIFDSAGSVGTVSLAGKTPLDELFRDLPFGQDALSSQSALLNALIGAEVEIEGDVTAKGRIFRVEREQATLPNNGGQIERHRLTLLTDKGFAQAILEDLRAVRFISAETRAQVDRALAGIAQNRAKDQRMLSIVLGGQTTRQASVSYVVAAPVWKTAYRLVLPKEGGKARLQGWGVLENLTGGDWKDIELALVSGNPVALRQALYTAAFVERPEIPVASAPQTVPNKDDAEGDYRRAPASRPRAYRAAPQAAAVPAPPPGATSFDGAAWQADELASATLAAETEDAATQVLYRFPFKITLASGSTMMIPFVDREIPATRTYLYQPQTNAHRPLAAIRLRNDGESAMPAGIITAFEAGADGAANFAGDAQLPLLAKGAAKFVVFAVDSKTDVRRSDQGTKQTRLGKIVRGELTLSVKSRWAIAYEITPPADEDREIFIEEPRKDGWKVMGNGGDIEETPTRLRYKVFAPKGKTTHATLARDHVDVQIVSLATLGPSKLLATITGLENDSPALREAITKLAALVADIDKIEARKRELDTERRKIGEDQDRIRKNLTSVGSGSDLGRRYLDTLKAQEDRLAAITVAEKALNEDLAAKTKAAEEIAQALVL